MDDPTTRLLTLLNVSATKPGKRKHSGEAYRSARLGGKRSIAVTNRVHEAAAVLAAHGKQTANENAQNSSKTVTGESEASIALGPSSGVAITAAAESDEEEATISGEVASVRTSASCPKNEDAFVLHFASDGDGSLAAYFEGIKGDDLLWEQEVEQTRQLGTLVTLSPSVRGKKKAPSLSSGGPHRSVLKSWQEIRSRSKSGQRGISPLAQELISRLSLYGDLYHSSLQVGERAEVREASACHVVSHILKTRRRIIKNNEKLAQRAAAGSSDIDVPRDQGFTRPKVLILAPMRNSALEWVWLLEGLSGCAHVDKKGRLEREYRLPEGAIDKLDQPEARDRYPLEHLETFKGNIDDNFRLGIKLTRKSLKLFSAFYDSDFIVASPLALRLAIEKDRDSDFLSSIEVLVADQMDVMTMQNWDHVHFVLNHLNKIPKESHDTDFSRVKQWYLDGKAANFRQSILLSAYDAPEMRSVFSHNLQNFSGKARTLQDNLAKRGIMGDVREGIRQSFVRFDCANLQAEHDLRFLYFTKKTIPNLLKSAMSASKTLIFVPSYFDFVRLEDHMRREQLSFASISEYSSGKDIARARQSFLSGKRNFLLMTERFHFYRRYVIRGAQTVVFYALPEHKDYFVEVLSFPFARTTSLMEALNTKYAVEAPFKPATDGQEKRMELDPSDVSVVALYSRYDLLRLQRIVGVDLARRMVEEDRGIWRFA